MAVAPQINEDLFGTKVFTVIFTIRDSGDTTDRTDAGYLEVIGTGGATITGDGTYQLTIEGMQGQVNTAMTNLNYVPAADFEGNVGISYAQTDDNGTAAPGSSPYNDFMSMSLRDTHTEYEIKTGRTYDENRAFIFGDFMQIKDLRGDTLPDTQYVVDITVDYGELPQSSFTGTKAEVNDALSNATFWPPVDFRDDDITFGYSQTQTTDSKVHVTNDTSGVLTFGNIDERYELNAPEHYAYNQILDMSDVFRITDGTPDYPQPDDLYYEVIISVDSGTLSQTTFTGTKYEINAELAQLTFTPAPYSRNEIMVHYIQTRTTDSIEQANVFSTFNVDNDTIVPDYEFEAASFAEDTILPLPDAFRITDILPDNIDPNIQYTVTLSADYAELSQTTFTGTKYEVNAELALLILTPNADHIDRIRVSYTQTQTTDGVIQADGEIYAVDGATAVHDEYELTDEQLYSKLTTIWNVGQITDLRPENIDINIQYEVVFTFPTEAGKLFVDDVEVVGNTLSGTKYEVNEKLLKVEFRKDEAYTSDFTMNYLQTQTTDGVTQADVDIPVSYITGWEMVYDDDIGIGNYPIHTIAFHEDRWIVGSILSDILVKTETQGTEWVNETLDYVLSDTAPTVYDCAISSSGHGLLVCQHGLFATRNGGSHFYDESSIFPNIDWYNVNCVGNDGGNDYVIGASVGDNYIKYTRNGGDSYYETSISNLVDDQKIWTVGVDSNGGWLLGGENILAQATTLDEPFYALSQSITVREIRYNGVFLIVTDDGIYRRDDALYPTPLVKVSDLVVETLDSDGSIWRAVVGGNDHYYSEDNGDTWYKASLGPELEIETPRIIRYDDVSGYWVMGTVSGRIFRSVNP